MFVFVTVQYFELRMKRNDMHIAPVLVKYAARPKRKGKTIMCMAVKH